jgi:aryl-alcohol dehydrogenase-like predicted oxidoreductase
MAPQLCLGTVQFGLPYGITNTAGQVPEEEVRRILEFAAHEGIEFLDTAQAYGDAEAVLGRTMPGFHAFRIISKLPAQSQPFFTAEDYLSWEDMFHRSCSHLGQHCLDAFLLHRAADLRKPGGDYLRQWLLSLKKRGLVSRLGLSIYTANDLEEAPPDLLDLVQLPLSLYDQRLLANGTISRLHSQGCKIHARSIYLQGLMLTSASEWPPWIHISEREHHAKLEQAAYEQHCSLMAAALGFARAQECLEAVVIGVCSLSETRQLMHEWGSELPSLNSGWQDWALAESLASKSVSIINPRNWPS